MPQHTAIPRVASTAAPVEKPLSVMSLASTQPHSDMMEPTERSNPPEHMAKVMPAAATATQEERLSTLTSWLICTTRRSIDAKTSATRKKMINTPKRSQNSQNFLVRCLFFILIRPHR
ncbi:MAG: hypothetical protein BWY83_01271 [bacterium ADurb.Bin478]|nr:MAG: hypothetical protein BWY83_01271 [bacterium ADurb.Bin478]